MHKMLCTYLLEIISCFSLRKQKHSKENLGSGERDFKSVHCAPQIFHDL